MRLGFTIVLNGVHHFEHRGFKDTMVEAFDHWVIVHGAAKNTGSTSWCKRVQKDYLNDIGLSEDGTEEYLNKLCIKNGNVTVLHVFDQNKDQMVNTALDLLAEVCHGKIPEGTNLWEVDVDEVWSIDAMGYAENELASHNGDTGMFHAVMWVGQNLVARGEWGEGLKLPYRRLWRWSGQKFKTHEPPILEGGNGKEILLQQRFDHYAYFFENDVQFKNDYYGGHEGIHARWLALQSDEQEFPQPISKLITGPWGETATTIYKV